MPKTSLKGSSKAPRSEALSKSGSYNSSKSNKLTYAKPYTSSNKRTNKSFRSDRSEKERSERRASFNVGHTHTTHNTRKEETFNQKTERKQSLRTSRSLGEQKLTQTRRAASERTNFNQDFKKRNSRNFSSGIKNIKSKGSGFRFRGARDNGFSSPKYPTREYTSPAFACKIPRTENPTNRMEKPARTHSSTNLGDDKLIVYGINASLSVLSNQSREVHSALMTNTCFEKIPKDITSIYHDKIKIVETDQISKKLGFKDKHQGILLTVGSLQNKIPLEYFLQKTPNTTIFILDEVQDPQNIGSIIRSAYCMGVNAIVMPIHNAPEIGNTIIRASAGYSEVLPIYQTKSSIARFILDIKEHNFTIIGLDGSIKIKEELTPKSKILSNTKKCFILGSEGFGISELAKKRCDILCKIPMIPSAESLNVATVAAIVGYNCYINSKNG